MENNLFKIELVGSERCLWRYVVKVTNQAFDIAPPRFEVEGKLTSAALEAIGQTQDPTVLSNGVTEFWYMADVPSDEGLQLTLVFRVAPDNPVVRFRYELASRSLTRLTKEQGRDNAIFAGLSLSSRFHYREVRLSEFNESVHSFVLTEHELKPSAFEHGLTAMGPILTATDEQHALLIAYEHGSQVPDAFVDFQLAHDRSVALEAVKGTYHAGQALNAEQSLNTVWFQFAAIAGDQEALARRYRSFVLEAMTLNAESRKPYVFYNTWNYQERNQAWNGASYLDSMHQDRMLAEIEVAHRIGIDVFVIDTGWYQKTGDWQVDETRFPDGLEAIRARLDQYGMKLGLWFSPTKAAVSSRMLNEHMDCRQSMDGRVAEPQTVWETEESYNMCLASRYWEAFADELIRLNRALGVTYFKWDAIHQYGCDDPHHWHGTATNSLQERADCYAFELGRYLTHIVDRVCQACPEAIVDFDVTEGQRGMGLGFLSAGKYFLVNNGPYYQSFDDPAYAPGGGMGANVFVFPGPARARVCRTPLGYDKWLPSVLFLTHYLPDEPETSQITNLASLVLGQNGVWGDLLEVSSEGVRLFGHVLGLYKQIRDDITQSSPVLTGFIGGSPEIHEKIHRETGRGVVAAFAAAAGKYIYVTKKAVADAHWSNEGVSITRDAEGRACIELTFQQPGAKLIFFGVEA